MKAFIFPGQGSQFPGMAKSFYDKSKKARTLFNNANDILGFEITKIMFEGNELELKQTNVTQPAIFLHSVVLAKILENDFKPDMVAGHSLGEFSALVANNSLDFECGLKLVAQRAKAMQKACESNQGTMAAVLGLDNLTVEEVCDKLDDVVPANYNCPGQLVISGSFDSINKACEILKSRGARRALVLPVGGAFHSPLMKPAREDLARKLETQKFKDPKYPLFTNVNGKAILNGDEIKECLLQQLLEPVLWTKSILEMKNFGIELFLEVGPGKVLQGLNKRIDRSLNSNGVDSIDKMETVFV